MVGDRIMLYSRLVESFITMGTAGPVMLGILQIENKLG
jgi:hypothetical protein